MNHPSLGRWYCQVVDQEQSDAAEEAFGAYDDGGMSREQKAAKTEFANATLEIAKDGRYTLEGEAHNRSHGTWRAKGKKIELSEAEDCTNGFEGLEYAFGDDERFTLGFKLNDDSHDGLDTLILVFGREAPNAAGADASTLAGKLAAADDEDEVYDMLDAAFDEADDPSALAAELWDAWMAGQLAADPAADNARLQSLAFGDERLVEAGGFSHVHASHALRTLEYDRDRAMFDTVVDLLPRLLKDDAADAELAPHIADAANGKWLERLTASRFQGGGTPEAFFARALMPQPATDEAARAHLKRVWDFTRSEAIEHLYPKGHPDFVSVILKYRGKGLLTLPLEWIDQRGLRAEAREFAEAWLADPASRVASSAGLSMMMFAMVFAVEAGDDPSPALAAALATEPKGSVSGGPDPSEKERLRGYAAKLPGDLRELAYARFWLTPKK